MALKESVEALIGTHINKVIIIIIIIVFFLPDAISSLKCKGMLFFAKSKLGIGQNVYGMDSFLIINISLSFI